MVTPMKENKPIQPSQFLYNPPLRVLDLVRASNEQTAAKRLFPRPKLQRFVPHDRVSRYFQKRSVPPRFSS